MGEGRGRCYRKKTRNRHIHNTLQGSMRYAEESRVVVHHRQTPRCPPHPAWAPHPTSGGCCLPPHVAFLALWATGLMQGPSPFPSLLPSALIPPARSPSCADSLLTWLGVQHLHLATQGSCCMACPLPQCLLDRILKEGKGRNGRGGGRESSPSAWYFENFQILQKAERVVQ